MTFDLAIHYMYLSRFYRFITAGQFRPVPSRRLCFLVVTVKPVYHITFTLSSVFFESFYFFADPLFKVFLLASTFYHGITFLSIKTFGKMRNIYLTLYTLFLTNLQGGTLHLPPRSIFN